MIDYISGEKIQLACDVWCGLLEDFNFNPNIRSIPKKAKDLNTLVGDWKNPTIIFCYGHRLNIFKEKAYLLKNPFILVSHNSDENITDKYLSLLNDTPLLIHMFSQNPCITHDKLSMIPIGFANSMWRHGNPHTIQTSLNRVVSLKSSDIYFYFNVSTNYTERNACKYIIESKGICFDRGRTYPDYLEWLSKHRYCICPEGNGVDTHRLWECYAFRVIPILKRNALVGHLEKIGLPYVVVSSWEDLNVELLTDALYESNIEKLVYAQNYVLSISFVINDIKKHIDSV